MNRRTGGSVVIGIGNDHRRDDGIGPAVAAVLAARARPGLRVVACGGEPAEILDAWTGADLAVLVDAADGGIPGRIRQCAIEDLADPVPLSSHDLGLRQTYELGRALDRVPAALVVVAVDVADTGHGLGLSPAVAAALPEVVRVVEGLLDAAVLEQAGKAADQQP